MKRSTKHTSRKQHPAFGHLLKAYRLRWAYWPSRHCFIRIQDTDDEGDGFSVELSPDTQAVPNKGNKGPFRVLTNCNIDDLAGMCCLRHLRRVKRYVKVELTEEGEWCNRV